MSPTQVAETVAQSERNAREFFSIKMGEILTRKELYTCVYLDAVEDFPNAFLY
jgi:hypothetical protein